MLPSAVAQEALADVHAAQGLAPVDSLLKDCRLVNVCSQEIHSADIAIRGSKIVGVREHFDGPAAKTLDCAGSYAISSFVQLEEDSDSSPSSCVSAWIISAAASSATDDYRISASRYSRRIHAPQARHHLASFRICSTLDDAIVGLRAGCTVFLAPQPNTEVGEILAAMRGKGIDTSRICLCLSHADDVSRLLHAARQLSFTAVEIFQMLSLNPARHFALDHEIGSIAPARQADILLTKSFDPFEPHSIVVAGELVFHEGRPCD